MPRPLEIGSGARAFLKTLGYIWASPCSLAGMLISLPALASGATPRLAGGVIEVAGGRIGRWSMLLPRPLRFAAITFGHVIIGTDHSLLRAVRRHEMVHVRQYERWGPLLIPLYLLSSLHLKLRHRQPYLENWFEVEAFAASPEDLREADFF